MGVREGVPGSLRVTRRPRALVNRASAQDRIPESDSPDAGGLQPLAIQPALHEWDALWVGPNTSPVSWQNRAGEVRRGVPE